MGKAMSMRRPESRSLAAEFLGASQARTIGSASLHLVHLFYKTYFAET